MNSSLIGKIEKARRYARERDRICINEFSAQFRGEHDTYQVAYKDGRWRCTCNFFAGWGVCSHTMALEKVFEDMIPKCALPVEAASETSTPQIE